MSNFLAHKKILNSITESRIFGQNHKNVNVFVSTWILLPLCVVRVLPVQDISLGLGCLDFLYNVAGEKLIWTVIFMLLSSHLSSHQCTARDLLVMRSAFGCKRQECGNCSCNFSAC